ncbi:hypothetical protein DFH06DRAFT_1128154 [Mycena polygramma]|nr:hypothetical protein DFH06DRAFT_1128154 [Mycena polygramma]
MESKRTPRSHPADSRLVVTADEAEAAKLPRLFLSTTILSSTFRLLRLGTVQTSARAPHATRDDPVRHGPITRRHFLVAARVLPWIPWPQSFEGQGSRSEGIAGWAEELDPRHRLTSRHAASTRRLLRSPYRIHIHVHPLRASHGGRDTCPRTTSTGDTYPSSVRALLRIARRARCYCSRAELRGMVPECKVSPEPVGTRPGARVKRARIILCSGHNIAVSQSSQKCAQHGFIARSDESLNSAHYVSPPWRVWQTAVHKLDVVDDDELASAGNAGGRVSTHYPKVSAAFRALPRPKPQPFRHFHKGSYTNVPVLPSSIIYIFGKCL